MSDANFNKDGIVFGLLVGTFKGNWAMSFYTTEKGRKLGIAHWRQLNINRPIFTFTLSLKEMQQRSIMLPFLPDERQKVPDKTVWFKRSKLT